MAINREQGLGVAQCASSAAGVDDLVPVKRSFVDAARSSRRLTGSRAAGPAVPPRQAGWGEAADASPLQTMLGHFQSFALHATQMNSTKMHWNRLVSILQ